MQAQANELAKNLKTYDDLNKIERVLKKISVSTDVKMGLPQLGRNHSRQKPNHPSPLFGEPSTSVLCR
ncbi:hypothetical protein DSF71_13695 [Salmonella enterica subsp. enterica serovar Hvittingfoss]|nr:hypothetical protein [Salmonella enterica subsp. enterica serovar Hvittingfoss]